MTEVITIVGLNTVYSDDDFNISTQKPWTLSLNHNRRIPHAACTALEEANSFVKQANDILEQTKSEIDAFKKQAYDDGFNMGHNEALAETVALLVQAKQKSREHVAASEHYILELTEHILKRIAPKLSQQDILPELVNVALKAHRSERYLRIRIHPSGIQSVHKKIAKMHNFISLRNSLELIGDDQLGRLDCIIESEVGCIYSSFGRQVKTLLQGAGELVQKVDADA